LKRHCRNRDTAGIRVYSVLSEYGPIEA